ncbi:hypothetical protein [Priestia aryabhattai]|uniref:hypothetical protein n=1 Tax=Priestia aryabhattai TaxID=412384 RepID=UPI002658FE53|nr:hypothetical protein [Priestia aryabhattai]WKG33403.1 hypothetical protein QYS54_27310 [Priestia aryabhattai]
MAVLLSISIIILKAILTGLVAVPVGFVIYNMLYYRFTKRDKVKQIVLEYLELANMDYDTSERGRSRYVLDEGNELVKDENTPIYPSLSAIMKWVFHNEVIQKGIKIGVKYDEAFFASILGELMMEGRITGIHDKNTDEIVAYKFNSFNL